MPINLDNELEYYFNKQVADDLLHQGILTEAEYKAYIASLLQKYDARLSNLCS